VDMTIEQAAFHALDAWQIEGYHRGLKQSTLVERRQYRLHILSGIISVWLPVCLCPFGSVSPADWYFLV
jgi:hypothetical protein